MVLTISGSKDISQTSFLATPKVYNDKYNSLFKLAILFSKFIKNKKTSLIG
ncbi:conserved hypothetical protein [Tenacibaculum halocynthiae]